MGRLDFKSSRAVVILPLVCSIRTRLRHIKARFYRHSKRWDDRVYFFNQHHQQSLKPRVETTGETTGTVPAVRLWLYRYAFSLNIC